MPKVTILKGLPASGKSTWAKEQVKYDKNTVIVNRDSLRRMRGEYWIPSQEDMITEWEDDCIVDALNHGHNVIVDATNLNDNRSLARIKTWKNRVNEITNVSHEFIHFTNVDVDECIRRDANRVESVGKEVIMNMYNKYLKPDPVEYIEDETLPHCIICDVDGTLALMNGRGPFDWDRVGEDSLNHAIWDILRMFKDGDTEIFLFSGRDAVCRPQTVEWLNKRDVPYTDIYMRPEGNTEDDRIIKKQMFEDTIRGKYYCDFVLDDRDKVVRMWREELGLTCLQVNYGNF